jgi:hypothetical protein
MSKRRKWLIMLSSIIILIIGIVVATKSLLYNSRIDKTEELFRSGNYSKAYYEICKIRAVKKQHINLEESIKILNIMEVNMDEFNDISKQSLQKEISSQEKLQDGLSKLINIVSTYENNRNQITNLKIEEKTTYFMSQVNKDLSLYFNVSNDKASSIAKLQKDDKAKEIQAIATNIYNDNLKQIAEDNNRKASEDAIKTKILPDRTNSYKFVDDKFSRNNKSYYIFDSEITSDFKDEINTNFKFYVDKDSKDVFATDNFMTANDFNKFFLDQEERVVALSEEEAKELLKSSELEKREAPRLGQNNSFKISNNNYEKDSKYYYKFNGIIADPQGWLNIGNKTNYNFYVNKHTKEIFATDEFMKIPDFGEYLEKTSSDIATNEKERQKEESRIQPTHLRLGEITKSVYMYIGKYVLIEGTIIYIKENFGAGDLILSDRYNNLVHVSYFKQTNYVKGKKLVVRGLVEGENSNFDQNGLKVTIPSLSCDYMTDGLYIESENPSY